MPKFYENVNFKRILSTLRNVKVNGKTPKAIFIADDVVFFRNCNDEHITLQRVIDINNKEIYKEINKDPSEILSKYDYTFKKKITRNRIDYVKVMKSEYDKLCNKEGIDMEQIKPYTKEEFYQTYVNCFASTSNQKNSSILFKLGKLKEKFEKNAVDIIYGKKFGNEVDDSKKKHQRAEIKKNLKGIDRFMIFSNRLSSGVHQLISIPITYFVKIKNSDWSKVLVHVNPHTAHLSINDDEEEIADLFVEDELEVEANEVEEDGVEDFVEDFVDEIVPDGK